MEGGISGECNLCGSTVITNLWLEDPKKIDKFEGISVDGERIVRLVFRKLR